MEMFSNEFRVRLSWIVSPVPSSICFSNSCMESKLVSRPMLSDRPVSAVAKYLGIYLLTSRAPRFRGLECPVAGRCGDGTTGTSLGPLGRGGGMRRTNR